MKNVALAVSLTALLTSCAAMQPVILEQKQSFNAADVAWADKTGTSAISGQAFVQTNGGQPRTCAGLDVYLIPSSAYARERSELNFGSVEGGYKNAYSNRKLSDGTPMDFANTWKKQVCDAQGNFEFSNIPAGEWYVSTSIVWTVQYVSNGGLLAKRVTVKDGEKARVILTP